MSIGLLALLDDVAMLVDDTAVVAKVAMKKTAGILGDDLAVNAEKASGYHASREIPVIMSILKGSLVNKVVILIFILPLSIYFPSLIGPVLILGGLYLSFEGAEKIYEYFYGIVTKTNHIEHVIELTEKQKIKSAILTDFILSIEIIVITLASVVEEPMLVKIIVVTFVSFLASVGVYGLVAGLVKIDDLGFYIKNKSIIGTIKYKFGNFLIALLPQLIKALMIIGTLAMLLVAGGIFTHNIEVLHHFYDNNFSFLYLFLFDMTISLIVGLILFSIFKLVQKFLKK